LPSRFPEWLKKQIPASVNVKTTRDILERLGLNTVCQSALCPNIGECFASKTATFMILGDTCTRNCRFCAVPGGAPVPPDPDEPERLAEAAAELCLKHVVITSVTRDDLPDGGAGQFVAVVQALKARLPEAFVEVLTPDFQGITGNIHLVIRARPHIYNHNVETVPRLYSRVRPQANYQRSLNLLEYVKRQGAGIYTKSGLMVGLGETREEVKGVLKDLRAVGCDIVTIGQYLRPSRQHLEVAEYVHPDRFAEYKQMGEELGFLHVASAPFVRSSFNAREFSRRYMSNASLPRELMD